MRIAWKWLAPAVAAALLIACGEQGKTPTASTVTATTMAADYTNNPDGGGPWIARYDFHYFADFFDRADGLVRVWVTNFPLDGELPWPWDNSLCGPLGTTAVHAQEISHWDPTHTDPSALYIENMKGPVWVVLTSRAPGATGPCALRPLIASGWGDVKYNDNNALGAGKPQEAWSVEVHAQLTLASGGPLDFRGHLTCVVQDYGATGQCHTEMNY